MLNVGVGKTNNYKNLESLSAMLNPNSSTDVGASGDKVSLTFKNISGKIITEMASVTAGAIKDFPDLDKDYVIVIADDGKNKTARVYRRSEILENFSGSEDEKKSLKKQLDDNPLLVYKNFNGLPQVSDDQPSLALSSRINEFLKVNKKIIDALDKAGHGPFANMLSPTLLKKL
ncbi:MAG: hypothetical protein ACRCTY_03150 [Candidatus Adiutrix sp.]